MRIFKRKAPVTTPGRRTEHPFEQQTNLKQRYEEK